MNEQIDYLEDRISRLKVIYEMGAASKGRGFLITGESTNFDTTIPKVGISRSGMGRMLKHEIEMAETELLIEQRKSNDHE